MHSLYPEQDVSFFSLSLTQTLAPLISKSCSKNQVEYSVPVSQVFCKISVLSILVRVHVMSKSIVYILVILQEFSPDMPILCISDDLLSILAITTRMSCLIDDQTVLIVEICLYS